MLSINNNPVICNKVNNKGITRAIIALYATIISITNKSIITSNSSYKYNNSI